jgi:hypothetical protein
VLILYQALAIVVEALSCPTIGWEMIIAIDALFEDALDLLS